MIVETSFVFHDKLTEIVKVKRQEIKALLAQYPSGKIPGVEEAELSLVAKLQSEGYPFFITEFKRQSPSEGDINSVDNPLNQVELYLKGGCGAISVLADSQFFGGSFDDVESASLLAGAYGIPVLHKDFILHPIQVYRGRQAGASAFLMIPRILEIDEINALNETAQELNMDILYEIHDLTDYEKIKHLNPKVIGVNNRDLATFKVALNRSNVIANCLPVKHFLIAESGIAAPIDLAVSSAFADGFLIGTALMKGKLPLNFTKNIADNKFFFKACGLRTKEDLSSAKADLVGINFSPISKRRISIEVLDKATLPENSVAVFRENSREEITEILKKYPFKYVQLYSDEVDLDFLKMLSQKVILGVLMSGKYNLEKALEFAAETDFFILDGPVPGSGGEIKMEIPADFPYPFMWAGGLNSTNLEICESHPMCFGVDIASGIEEKGEVSLVKIKEINQIINKLERTSFHKE
ncbi:MAG: indole-3-glycerol phosphate synthase [Sphingobacteriales bacterium]|jgi:indole-3-glycerol phosphate synthase